MNDNDKGALLSARWHFQFDKLSRDIDKRLDNIHEFVMAQFRSLAKSTGQRTRSDRL